MLRVRKQNDEAVSPVIAVILMVAITVVLAATVYVWVSGFSGGGPGPAKTISLTSAGAIDADGDKSYTVASATPGMKWGDVKFTLDGEDLIYNTALNVDRHYCIALAQGTCAADKATADAGLVQAGQTLTLNHASLSGKTLRVLDTQANSVILTLTVG